MDEKYGHQTDERDAKNFGYASHWGMIVVFAYTMIKIIYYVGFSNVENYNFLLWDIFLVFLIAILFIIISYKRKSFLLPVTFAGGKLKTDIDKESLKERVLKAYIPRATLHTIIFVLVRMVMLSNFDFKQIVFEFVLFGVTVFIPNFLIGEFMVRHYNKSLDE